MSAPAATAALALLAAAVAPFDLPPLPHADEGYAAVWAWLRTVNDALTIPDPLFRRKVGGLAIPILLVLELVGIRKTWKLYRFLTPFWLILGGIAFGAVAGVAAAAAHLVLFPLGRLWATAGDRARSREPERTAPAPAPRPPAPVGPAQAARSSRPVPPVVDVLRAALETIRTAAAGRELEHPAAPAPGRPVKPSAQVILRAVGEALRAGRAAQASDHGPARPPPLAPRPLSEATGAPPTRPELARFRPDLSRFRRRLPRG